MLVLTREIGQKLVIGNEIVIEVLSVSGEGIRLGISAPRETSVHRFEIFEQIQAANVAASNSSGAASKVDVSNFAAQLRAREKTSAPSDPATAATSEK